MYFWNINSLKRQLAQDVLPQNQAWKYLLASLITTGFINTFGQLEAELCFEDYLYYAAYSMITIVGSGFLYKSNRGNQGKDFLGRYFALLWVAGIRWLSKCLFIFFSVFFLFKAFYIELDIDSIFFYAPDLLIYLLFYWRLNLHMLSLNPK